MSLRGINAKAVIDAAKNEKRNELIVIQGAKWGIARAQRSLGHLNEAFRIQSSLLVEYDSMMKKKKILTELLMIAKGVVYEELAEIHQAYMTKYAALAYQSLSKDPWFIKLEPMRLKKMKVYSEC